MNAREYTVELAVRGLNNYNYLDEPVDASDVRVLLLSLFERLDKADDRIRYLERKLGVDP